MRNRVYVLKRGLISGSFLTFLDTYTIIEARFAILGHFSAASAATGPFMSDPLISPSGVTNTAALSSKVIRRPVNLLSGYFCLIITAPKICFRRSALPF